MSSKNNKKKGKSESEDSKKPEQAPLANATVIQTLKLKPLTNQSQFDYNSQLFLTYLKSILSTLQNIQHGETLTVQVFGENEQFLVKSVGLKSEDDPSMNKIVAKETLISVSLLQEDEQSKESEDASEIETLMKQLTLNNNSTQKTQFGGFQYQLDLLREVIELKLLSKQQQNVKIKGVLLHGPSGIGKTLAIQSILEQLSIHTVVITPKHLVQAQNGMIKKLQDAFKLVKIRQPSILVLEEIDFIANSKSQSKDLFYTFLSELDNIDNSSSILTIATTNKLEDVDKSLRRGGRLDIDIRFDMPSSDDRYHIFKAHLSDIQDHEIKDQELELISKVASGFVSSDIAQIIRNSHLKAIKGNNGILTKLHLEQAIIEAKPLSIQELLVEVPKVQWSEIGGNEEIKFKVRQCVEWPLKYSEKFELMGFKPPTGILLYGPPGCSKTMIAKALATESGLNFIAIKGPELFSKYVGDTEKAIREIFRKARLSSPSIIFFDEIDAMATQRGNDDTSVSDRALCQLLNEMDGIESKAHVIVVAATNRLDIIDQALLRPGRFDRHIYVPLPDSVAREDIFRINLSKMQKASDIDLKKLADLTDGLSGAEISLICREAGLKALTEDMNIEKESLECIKVTNSHLEKSLQEVKNRGKHNEQQQEGVFNKGSLFQ